jgi:MoxR-like ATPase
MADGLADDIRARAAGPASAPEAPAVPEAAEAADTQLPDRTSPSGADPAGPGRPEPGRAADLGGGPDEVATAVVGAEPALELLLIALAVVHALIEDVPGVGKTFLARAFSRALGLTFARVQGTPDLLPGDVTGSSILEGGTFRFVAGPVFHNVLLVDEVNRATPRTQSALLESMQERQVSIEGTTRPA